MGDIKMRIFFMIFMLSSFIFCSTVLAELVDNGDGTVTDTKTGLVWQNAEAGTMTWEKALAYCEALELAGHNDWRLPDKDELQSLFDAIYDNPSPNKAVFPNISWGYWSSTASTDDTSKAMNVSFMAGDGSAYAGDKNNGQDVRAVRSGQ